MKKVGGELFQPPAATIINDILSAIEETASGLISEAFTLLPPNPSNAPGIALALTQHLRELFQKADSFALQLRLTPSGALDSSQKSEVRDRLDRLFALHHDSVATMIRDDNAPVHKKRGPKGKHDWPKATTEVWGQIYRGDLVATAQKDIELALSKALSGPGKKGPEPSNCRPHARPIWQACNLDPQDNN